MSVIIHASALALLARAAQWALDEEHDARALAATRRYAQSCIDLIADETDVAESFALTNDSLSTQAVEQRRRHILMGYTCGRSV
jgi:hypothetical protein